jgi:hypothetical protein
MVSRMSPMFEMSDVALTVVMIVGAITALFMGLLGIVQNDIKKSEKLPLNKRSHPKQLSYNPTAIGLNMPPLF